MSDSNNQFEVLHAETHPPEAGFFKKNGLKHAVWEGCKLFVFPILLVLLVRIYIIQPFIVKGTSMEPNFEDSEYLIVDEITPALSAVDRGTVLIFRYPFNTSEFFIKRLIGLPGERVTIKDNKITITTPDKKRIVLDESYLARGMVTVGDVDMDIPAGQYFVLGDNRIASYDSRRWGLVPKEDIVGRAVVRLWPLDKIDVIRAPKY